MSGVQERREALVQGQGATPLPIDVQAGDREIQRRQGHQVMATVMSFGAAAESGRLARAVKVAQLVCITCVCVLPVVAFWGIALGR